MADNAVIYPGDTGTPITVATDDDGTAQHPYVKLEFGGDGTFTKVATGDPLPVTISGVATAALQTTLNGHVDGIETLLGRLLPRATTVVDVSLASAATSAQLLAANANRIGLTLTNTDANGVYVYFGTTATATKFTVLIPADGYYEMPQPIYTGRIDAIWSANGSGSLIGTELAA
jgi:hypothetical protein